MIDIQQTVDELRFLLQREVVDNSDELKTLITAYNAICHETNLRLRRCDDCLKQGLRSEALHLADARPNLLDSVATLDFPEREDLIEITNLYFLTTPEPLLLDVAAALNTAYSEQEPLQKLLDQHRLLALGRSPLGQRLIVLRRLAELDSASPHWADDVRNMELARLREIDAESVAAVKANNTAVLSLLVNELKPDGWHTSPSTELTQNVKSRASQVRRGTGKRRLEELNRELNAAFSALDVSTARDLHEEWQQRRQQSQIDDFDPLIQDVEPVLKWLQDENRKLADSRAFSKLVSEIETLLESDDATPADLERLRRAAERFDRGLPGTLETRFRSRLKTAEVIEGRRRRMIVGASVGAIIAVAAVFGFILYRSAVSESTRQAVAAVQRFVDDQKLDEAQQLVDQHGANATSESWMTVKKNLSDARQAEQDRLTNWKAEVASARESQDEMQISAALKRARDLSKTAEEKVEVGQLQSAWQKRASSAASQREQNFREMIESVTAQLKKLDSALASSDAIDLSVLRPEFARADLQVGQILTLRESVSKELASQATLLDSRLKATHRMVDEIEKRTVILSKLTDTTYVTPADNDASTKVARFEATLKEFMEALPNDPRLDIVKTITENNPLSPVIAAQKLLDRWKRPPSRKSDIESRLGELRSFLAEFPSSPDRELFRQYESWLSSVLCRFEDDGDPDEGVQQRMLALFNGKLIREGHVLRFKQNDIEYKVYLEGPMQVLTGDPVPVKYISNFNGEVKTTSVPRSSLLTTKTEDPPQQAISKKVRNEIRDHSLDGWNDFFADVVTLLMKNNALDPVLKYILVLKTIENAGRGDNFLQPELAPLLDQLNDDGIDRSVPWMNPYSKSAIDARSRASDALSRLPPVKESFDRARHRQQQFEATLFKQRFAVGWLERKSPTEWVCQSRWKPNAEHELLVVSRADTGGQRTWSTLGQASIDSIAIDSAIAQSVGEFSVVFASAITKDRNTVQVPQ